MNQADVARCITDRSLGQSLAWMLDLSYEDVDSLDPRYTRVPRRGPDRGVIVCLRMRHLNEVGRMAHAVYCGRVYRGEKARRKAMRRLIRLAGKECPEVLGSNWEQIVALDEATGTP